MILRGVLIWLLLTVSCASALAHWACTTQESTCKLVFVVHDTWHAAIVLPKSDIALDSLPELVDFPDAEFIEFSWGDKDYFPNPDAGIFSALKAAFWSSGSVLHVVGFRGDVKTFYGRAEIVELYLSAPAYARLQDFIAQTFLRPEAGRAQASAGLLADSHFYPATHKFSLVKTCNTWVAEALEAAGLPIVSDYVMTPGQLAEQLGKLNEQR